MPTAAAPADSIDTLLDNNRLLRAAFDTRIGDMRLWELVAATRREVLAVATEYTGSYRDVERPRDVADWIARPIIMGGHQPELFHAGVWLKNSALDAYARHVGGTAVNLIVDTDRCNRAAVGVPLGTPQEARLEMVPFDGPGPDTRPIQGAQSIRDHAVEILGVEAAPLGRLARHRRDRPDFRVGGRRWDGSGAASGGVVGRDLHIQLLLAEALAAE